MNIPCKIPNHKALAHLVFESNVFSGHLTDLSQWMDFCTSCPQQGVKCHLRYLHFFKRERTGGSMNIPFEIPNVKVFNPLGFN
jgi:hypothetical protein